MGKGDREREREGERKEGGEWVVERFVRKGKWDFTVE